MVWLHMLLEIMQILGPVYIVLQFVHTSFLFFLSMQLLWGILEGVGGCLGFYFLAYSRI